MGTGEILVDYFIGDTNQHVNFLFTPDVKMADVLNETVENISETIAKNETERIPSTPEGMAVAYGSLVVMALLPIFFGSYRSVRFQKDQKVIPVQHMATKVWFVIASLHIDIH